ASYVAGCKVGERQPSVPPAMRFVKALERGQSPALDPSTKMPTNEQDRTAEAVRRKLPELRVLERYAPLRDKTVRSAPSHLGQGDLNTIIDCITSQNKAGPLCPSQAASASQASRVDREEFN